MEKETQRTIEKGKRFVESIIKEYGHLSLDEFSKKIDENKVTNFSEITDCKGMLSYLRDMKNRIKPDMTLYHYTNVKKALAIINGGYWYVGSPKNMNDGL